MVQGLVVDRSHGSRPQTSELLTPVRKFLVFQDEEDFVAVLHDVTVDSLKREGQVAHNLRRQRQITHTFKKAKTDRRGLLHISKDERAG